MHDAEDDNLERSLVDVFHRVNSLLPDDQQVLSAEPTAAASDVLRLMEEHGFSQIPVLVGDAVIGVFTYRSLARRILELRATDLDKLDVGDCLEEFVFARPSDDLDSMFGHLDRDGAVLVGDPDRLQAVATATDVIRYLYGVSHPFVLIQEIELVLRALVSHVSEGPSLEEAIARVLRSKYVGREDTIPTKLIDLDLSDLVAMVTNGQNHKEMFASVVGRNRDSVRSYLEPIPRIRNDVFHFRRPVSGEDHQTLANTRTWLLRKARAVDALEGGRE